MARNIKTFTDQFDAAIAGHPDKEKLALVTAPFMRQLAIARAAGKKDEFVIILGEMKASVALALEEFRNGPDKPIDPFTDKSLLMRDLLTARRWVEAQFKRCVRTNYYFGFNKLKNIDGEDISPPTNDTIMDALTVEKIRLINNTIQRPILIMTPIGVSLHELVKAFDSKKGAMEAHQPTVHWWNETLMDYFDQDTRGTMAYGYGNDGVSKKQLLENCYNKGWQILVVEGSDEMTNMGVSPLDLIENFKSRGLAGLTPEDGIMLEAEGVRMGKPFGDNRSWLIGATVKNSDKIPQIRWSPTTSRVVFHAGYSDRLPDPNVGCRPAVRLI